MNQVTMPNGRHVGKPITRVPVGYLKWMINEGHGLAAEARKELDRRGTVTPDLDVSGHAIDRASLRIRKIWHETRGEDEGLYSWLVRQSQEALKQPEEGEGRHRLRYQSGSVIYVFERDGEWPVLKTVLFKR